MWTMRRRFPASALTERDEAAVRAVQRPALDQLAARAAVGAQRGERLRDQLAVEPEAVGELVRGERPLAIHGHPRQVRDRLER